MILKKEMVHENLDPENGVLAARGGQRLLLSAGRAQEGNGLGGSGSSRSPRR
jgi:hypothetical protein